MVVLALLLLVTFGKSIWHSLPAEPDAVLSIMK